MTYKDKDKQREANRKAQAKFKAKGITEGITKQGITLPKDTDLGNTLTTTQTVGAVIPEDQRKPDINYGPYMTANQLAAAGLKVNRVSKPGDADYNGVCTKEWRVERGR